MDVLAPVRALDRAQHRHKWLAIPLAVVKKFGDDSAGNLAALVAYYGFFSLFPLLLVMTTILGFVLRGNPSFQQSVEKSVLGQIPVIGPSLQLHSLTGNVASLVIGLVISLLGALGVTGAAQTAFDQVWAVPRKNRPDFLKSRLRGLALISALGILFIVATAITGLTSGIHGPLGKIAAVVLGYVVNFALFAAAFRFLTSATVPMRCLWIGVAFAALFWLVLQFFGGLYINHVVRHASQVGGNFALVLGLLVWLHLGAQMTLYATEINVVLARRLWPRSLIGAPDEPADEETLTALAKVEERHDTEQVEVHFDREDQSPDGEQPPGASQRAPTSSHPPGASQPAPTSSHPPSGAGEP